MSDPPISPATPGQPARSAPSLRLADAARACGVGRSSIRRLLDAGRLPGAFREAGPAGPGTGPWRVLVPELLAAGLHLQAPEQSAEQSAGPSTEQGAELVRVRQELEQERTRRLALERVVDAERRRGDGLELALRALTAGEAPERARAAVLAPGGVGVPPAGDPPAQDGPPVSPRRSWWRRLAGDG